MYATEFLTIAVAHLFAVASPGPDFAIVLRNSIVSGPRAGVWTSLGIGAGILLHVSYCVLGIAFIISSSDLVFTGVKLVAALYLAYLGFTAIKASFQQVSNRAMDVRSSNTSTRALIFSGFLTNGLNPKATLFFLALFSVVVDSDTPVLVQAGYGVYLASATFIWFVMVSYLAGLPAIRSFLLRAGSWFERTMGIILIALSIQIAFSLAAG